MKVKSIVIIGRVYKDRLGQSYHSCSVVVNGVFLFAIGETYGYGDQYVETALKELQKRGLISRLEHNSGHLEAPHLYAKRTGVKIHYEASDVSKKICLHQAY